MSIGDLSSLEEDVEGLDGSSGGSASWRSRVESTEPLNGVSNLTEHSSERDNCNREPVLAALSQHGCLIAHTERVRIEKLSTHSPVNWATNPGVRKTNMAPEDASVRNRKQSAKHLHRYPKIKLKLRHHCIKFSIVFTTWKSLVHGIPSEPGLTRKIRQLVIFHNDLIGRDWISESDRTRMHQFIHNVHGLQSNRNLYLLDHIVTHCSGCQWRNLTVVWTNCVRVSPRTSLQHLCFARQPRERMGFCTSHAWKSTRIIRASGCMNPPKRPPSCLSRAPFAVRISKVCP